jgi:hypothetical protein
MGRERDCDATINQSPGDGASSAVVVQMPLYSFDLHLAGKHHPGSTEIVPQMKMERLQLFAAEQDSSFQLFQMSDESDWSGSHRD